MTWLIWIGCENRELASITAAAAWMAGTFGLSGFARWVGQGEIDRRAKLARATLMGVAAGASDGPLAPLLMLLKLGLHTHVTPGFGVADLVAVLGRTPVRITIGPLPGLAGGLPG